jgi:A/G-specific adenine glycosylase
MTNFISDSQQADFSRTFQASGLTGDLIIEFRNTIYQHYELQGRRLPWRRTNDPYKILVSEIMLQQTQVERVLTKYESFLQRFPGFPELARAPLRDILEEWQGLGYNRRAKYLQEIAQRLVAEFQGQLPANRKILENLPGIGTATAGALMAFAFEQPVIFLETNIRRVYLHFFYPETEAVSDNPLLLLIMLTLDIHQVRPWYYALMDYGAWLKKAVPNPNRRSAHYVRQSPFHGSDREIRSWLIRLFVNTPELPESNILHNIPGEPVRIKKILKQLIRENFLHYQSGHYRLATGLESCP